MFLFMAALGAFVHVLFIAEPAFVAFLVGTLDGRAGTGPGGHWLALDRCIGREWIKAHRIGAIRSICRNFRSPTIGGGFELWSKLSRIASWRAN